MRKSRQRGSWGLFIVLPVVALVVGGVAGWVEFHVTDAAASTCPDVRTMVSQVGAQLTAGRVAQAERSARAWAAKLEPKMQKSKDVLIGGTATFTLESLAAGLRGPDGRAYTKREFDQLTSGLIDACKSY